MNRVLFELKNVSNKYRLGGGLFAALGAAKRAQYVKVLDDINLAVFQGETLGIVGESGCGKTTLARCILRLTDNIQGEIYFKGKNILNMLKNELGKMRQSCQIIFQNPYSSLNPNMIVREIISEGIGISDNLPEHAYLERIKDLCKKVNFPIESVDSFPSQLSGGGRRRVNLARVLAVKPEFIIADEPVASLDASIKSQIINLISELRKNENLTFMIISHDITFIKYTSNRIAVMYLGNIMELGENRQFRVDRSVHPYTRELIQSAEYIASGASAPMSKTSGPDIELEPDAASQDIAGCKYRNRCYLYREICESEKKKCETIKPLLEPYAHPRYTNHFVACHYKHLVTVES